MSGGNKFKSPYASMMDRLLANSRTVGDCWVWNGPVSKSGYGRVTRRVKDKSYPVSFYVHRVAWEIQRGEIPRGFDVDHLREEGLCRFKTCWRIEHLQLLSEVENGRKARRFQLSTADRAWMRAHGIQSALL
jgi:hypothetical protein